MEDTIAAVATTIGESSINVIRISGNNSINNSSRENTINDDSQTYPLVRSVRQI